jgi:hypothetical protein
LTRHIAPPSGTGILPVILSSWAGRLIVLHIFEQILAQRLIPGKELFGRP